MFIRVAHIFVEFDYVRRSSLSLWTMQGWRSTDVVLITCSALERSL